MNIVCITKTKLIVDYSNGSVIIHSTHTRRYELVGVLSLCNSYTSEGIFTRIIPYSNWILEILKSPSPTLPPLFLDSSTTLITPKPDRLGEFHNRILKISL